jgi:hypothetical protein
MLHKCVNPVCLNLFRCLNDGKLFKVEGEKSVSPNPARSGGIAGSGAVILRKNQVRVRPQHFWLCDECSSQITLTFESGRGMIAVPINNRQALPPTLIKAWA